MNKPLQISFALFLLCVFTAQMSYARDKFLNIQEHKTEGGITFWLVEDHSIPVIALDFAFDNAGSKYDSKEQQGLSRLVSNTMDEGAGDLASEDFQGELRRQSISLSFNAGRDTFGGSLQTRTSTKERAGELLHLALSTPRFEKDDVQRMKDANIARIRSSMSDPEWISARLSNEIIFEGHPYALNSGGTISTLQAITEDDLKTFVSQRLAKDVLKIGLVGDITAEDAKIYIDTIFKSLPEKQSLNKTVPDLDLQNAGKTYLYKLDIPQTIVQGYLPALSRKDPDFYAFQVMNQILGAGGFGSRLTEEVREKRGLTYGIYTYLTQMEHANFLTLSSSTANPSAKEMINLSKTEMKRIGDEPVSNDELKNAISYINGSMPLSLSSTSNISSLLLGMQIDDLPIDYLDHRAGMFESVSVEDIQKVAKKYLETSKMTTIILGNPEGYEEENVTKLTEIPNVE